MVYLYNGAEPGLLKQEVMDEVDKKIGKADSFNLSSFDMYNDLIQDAVSSAELSSLSQEHKCVVVDNCYFLSSGGTPAPASWTKQQDFDSLINYLKAQNPDCDMYLLSYGPLLANRTSKVVSELNEHAIVVIEEKLTNQDFMENGMRYVGKKGGDIDREALYEAVERSSGDYMAFTKSLDKLLCYTNKIRLVDVQQMIERPLDDNVFAIIESLFKSNVKDAITAYRDLIAKGQYGIGLLPIFASQLRFFYQVSYLLHQHKGENDIAKELKCNPFRVKYAITSVAPFSPSSILKMMVDLGEAEEHIKYDLDDADTSLELFIINFRRNYAAKLSAK